MPSGAVLEVRGRPLQPKSAGLPGITRQRVGLPLKIFRLNSLLLLLLARPAISTHGIEETCNKEGHQGSSASGARRARMLDELAARWNGDMLGKGPAGVRCVVIQRMQRLQGWGSSAPRLGFDFDSTPYLELPVDSCIKSCQAVEMPVFSVPSQAVEMPLFSVQDFSVTSVSAARDTSRILIARDYWCGRD